MFKKLCTFFMILLCTALFCSNISAEKFIFKYQKGDTYRILKTIKEDVYVNGNFDHHAEIVNRISYEISNVEDSWATHDAEFRTIELSTNDRGQEIGTYGKEYLSKYKCNQFGEYKIDDSYFMPVIRNVPVFPDKNLENGDIWTSRGEEAHDLTRLIVKAPYDKMPFKVPFDVKYIYAGTENLEGKKLHKIIAEYNMFYTNPVTVIENTDYSNDYPISTLGYSRQTIYWNATTGGIEYCNEDFRIILELMSGNQFEFIGTSFWEIDEMHKAAPEQVDDIKKTVDDLNIDNVEIRKDDKGITISLENIRFKSDSAILEKSEQEKLVKIAKILEKYKNNDLLISGHTALAGTAEERMQLSKERADSVAAYLIELGVKDKYHIFTQGFGAERPVADNSTKEGMARNRRVEITILEK